MTEELEAEIARLRGDNERLQGIFAFAEAAGKAERDGLVAEIARLRAALEPFGRNARAESLSAALAHITREDLLEAWDATQERSHD